MNRRQFLAFGALTTGSLLLAPATAPGWRAEESASIPRWLLAAPPEQLQLHGKPTAIRIVQRFLEQLPELHITGLTRSTVHLNVNNRPVCLRWKGHSANPIITGRTTGIPWQATYRQRAGWEVIAAGTAAGMEGG